MKKIVICLMAICLTLTLLPLQSDAAVSSEPSSLVAPKPAPSSEARVLELRLNEINTLDKSKMKPAERKSLQKEVKSVNPKLREAGGGVYVKRVQ